MDGARRTLGQFHRGAFRRNHPLLLLFLNPDLHQPAQGRRASGRYILFPDHLANYQRVSSDPHDWGIRPARDRRLRRQRFTHRHSGWGDFGAAQIGKASRD